MQGILRTDETLAKFKSVSSCQHTTRECPLFHYCDSLVQTVPVYGQLSVAQAVTCVQSAMKCGEQQKVAQWIAQGNVCHIMQYQELK